MRSLLADQSKPVINDLEFDYKFEALPVTALLCPFNNVKTHGGLLSTEHMDNVPSRDEQHIRERSLLANFTIVTALVCFKLFLL